MAEKEVKSIVYKQVGNFKVGQRCTHLSVEGPCNTQILQISTLPSIYGPLEIIMQVKSPGCIHEKRAEDNNPQYEKKCLLNMIDGGDWGKRLKIQPDIEYVGSDPISTTYKYSVGRVNLLRALWNSFF